jgi:hypothetical protein
VQPPWWSPPITPTVNVSGGNGVRSSPRASAGTGRQAVAVEGGIAVGLFHGLAAAQRTVVDAEGIAVDGHRRARLRREAEDIGPDDVLHTRPTPVPLLMVQAQDGVVVPRILVRQPGRVDVGLANRLYAERGRTAVVAGGESDARLGPGDAVRSGDDQIRLRAGDHTGGTEVRQHRGEQKQRSHRRNAGDRGGSHRSCGRLLRVGRWRARAEEQQENRKD